jgi:lysophospholipase L1-like esterase
MANILFIGPVTLFINNKVPKVDEVAVALEKFIGKLNQTISATVQKWATTEKVNAKVIPGTATALAGHRLGDQPAQLWMNGIILNGLTPSPESFHPNCLGHKALAERVLENLGRAVPGGWVC